MRLLLIRHGQTPGNVLGQLDTAFPGPGLTELGERQAAALPLSLGNQDITAIYVSTLIRTQLTAAPLAQALSLEPIVLDGIQEIDAGSLEKRTDHEAHHIYMNTVFDWPEGKLDVRMPGAGDGHEFFDRYDAAIAKVVAAGDETAVVVSHGAAIRCWAGSRATDVDRDFAATHQLQNTGIVVLEGDPESGWRLLHWDQSPVGGLALADRTAEDPTGETVE